MIQWKIQSWLFAAVTKKDLQKVKNIVLSGGIIGNRECMGAVVSEDRNIINFFIESNFKNCYRMMEYAAAFNLIDVVKYLINNYDVKKLDEVLITAVIFNRFDIVRYLLDCGADIYFNNLQPLEKAMSYKNYDIVKLFASIIFNKKEISGSDILILSKMVDGGNEFYEYYKSIE